MRLVLATLTLLALAGIAGTATAHYLVEQETPVGTLCLVNDEDLQAAIAAGDAAAAAAAIATIDCADEE